VPEFLIGAKQIELDQPIFVSREQELTQLDGFLDQARSGQGRVAFITGEIGSGKTALMEAFTKRALENHPNLIVARGNCNAHTGTGDPYLPFREMLELLTGDMEARWAAGAITLDHARRLWQTLPLTVNALIEFGHDLIETFISGTALVERAKMYWPLGDNILSQLEELVAHKMNIALTVGFDRRDLIEQYTRVLLAVARQSPLIVVIDDLQWADTGSISLLFHLGRQLSEGQIMLIGAYRPEEITLGRDGERHPLEPVVNELQREFGEILVVLGQTQNHAFVNAILDHEPNQLDTSFREMLFRQTQGHPLFTIELLRGLQERGDLVQDKDGQW
jgi:predicted ATPase